MTAIEIKLTDYDEWLSDSSEVAALIMRQWLLPVEGKDAIIFPPTYAGSTDGKNTDKSGYNIDHFPDNGLSVCQIDSVGSQANRMEPIFKRLDYKNLVPQVVIKAEDNGTEFNLLDVGHRAADAVVCFSTLNEELNRAFTEYQHNGDATALAKIAPTSIVFGSWDSRHTQAKLPRLIRSVIRAYKVRELHRSAQYSTSVGALLGDEVTTGGAKAELGLAHVPAVRTHGGILVEGELRREAILNLSALRTVGVPSNKDETMKLRRYILGLSLVCFTAPMEPNLREGCELVPDEQRKAEWKLVKYDGSREEKFITHDKAMKFAQLAAKAFGVGEDRPNEVFKTGWAKRIMQLDKTDRDKLFKTAVTEERIIEAEKGKKGKTPKLKDTVTI